MEYRFAVPSFNRLTCLHTLETLRKLGFRRDEIIIQTQTYKDYTDYKRKFGFKASILYKPGANVAENRNNALDYFGEGERIIMIDDDIKAFCKLQEKDGKKTLRKIPSKVELKKLFDSMFDFCEKNDSPIWGWYPVQNAYFMKKTVDMRNIFIGTILGIVNSKSLRFNTQFDLKEDYEMCLRLISQGHNAVRFNSYTCEANHKSKGGCMSTWKTDHNAMRCKQLLDMYPGLIKPSHRENEIRYVGGRKGASRE